MGGRRAGRCWPWGRLLVAWGCVARPSSCGAPKRRATAATRRSPARVALVALAALLTVAAVPGFVRLAQSGGQAAPGAGAPWGLWLVAMAALVAAGRPACGAGRAPRPAAGARFGSWARRAAPWLVISAAAAFLRLYALDLVPRGFWADESIAAVQAQDILEHGWRPLFIGGATASPRCTSTASRPCCGFSGRKCGPYACRWPWQGSRPWPRLGGSQRRLYGRRWRWRRRRCWR